MEVFVKLNDVVWGGGGGVKSVEISKGQCKKIGECRGQIKGHKFFFWMLALLTPNVNQILVVL